MNLVDQKSRFADARTLAQGTQKKLDTLLRTPVSSSEPPAGKVVGDAIVTTSEEELLTLVRECKESPEKMEFVLSHVEHLLKEGELIFKDSQTHATKITKP